MRASAMAKHRNPGRRYLSGPSLIALGVLISLLYG